MVIVVSEEVGEYLLALLNDPDRQKDPEVPIARREIQRGLAEASSVELCLTHGGTVATILDEDVRCTRWTSSDSDCVWLDDEEVNE